MNRTPHLQKKSANATCAAGARCVAFGLMLALPSFPLFAQGLPDPTRPPAGFVDPADPGSPASMAGQNLPSAGAGSPEAMVLQSVMLPQKGKPVAIISGRYVPLGAQIDGWELKSVSEREVAVQQGSNRRVLRLTPLVSKSPARTGPEAATGTSKKPLRKNKVKQAVVKESEPKQ